MLSSLRNFAKSWIAGIFILLLIASFAVWGVGDMFRNATATTVATVGDAPIEANDFARELRQRLNAMTREYGRPVTIADARSAGVDGSVLNLMITRLAVSEGAKAEGVTAGDVDVATRIKSLEGFRTESGAFDRFAFDNALRDLGMNENDFAESVRDDMARQQYLGAAGLGIAAPSALVEALYARAQETRDIRYIVVGEGAIVPVGAPDDATLQAYYDSHANLFSTPELRKATVLTISAEELAKDIEVSDDDLREAYEARQAEFTRPAQREIDQLMYPDQESADAAVAELAGGAAFEDVAKASGFAEGDYNLGAVGRDGLAPKVADAAFAATEPGVVGPVETAFGFAVLRVRSVAAEEVTPFEEARETLAADLALERAQDLLFDVSSRLEDERAAGATLEEAAEALKLPIQVIEAMDENGRDADGAEIGDPPPQPVMEAIFAADEGAETELLETPEGGYAIARVDAIAAPAVKPLEAVRDDAIARWRQEETRGRIQARADKARSAAQAYGLESAARALAVEIAVRDGVGAQTVDADLSQTLLTTLFAVAPGTVVEGPRAEGAGEGRVVAIAVAARRPDPTTPAAKEVVAQLAERVSDTLRDDIVGAVVGEMRVHAGVQIYPDAMDQVLGPAMIIAPDFEKFAAAYDAGRAQLVATELVGDLETPVSVYLKVAEGRGLGFLLESVEGETRARYSAIGLKPDVVWRCRGDVAEINRDARWDAAAFVRCDGGALESLRALIAESRIDAPHALPGIACGLYGYLAYDMVRLVERLPAAKPDPIGLPDAMLIRPTVVVVFDGVKDTMTVASPVWPQPGVNARAAYARAGERIADVVGDLDRALARPGGGGGATGGFGTVENGGVGDISSNTTVDEYHAMVAQAKEYIRAGDAFQIVPSQRFSRTFPLPPFALYRALRRTNPSPYMFHLDLGDFAIVGASPEVLVGVKGGAVTIRPIAGTRPRGADPDADLALEVELLADPKERAEHLMLLDLGRNDVGRVAKLRSVRVTEQFVVERYSHVMHIVSNVVGDLRDDVDALAALLAGLPAGTVSGAPKVRAMEIINELEKEKRGVYAGGVGYFAANGDMDLCIALRTAVVKDGVMYVQAGGGVVADSDPAAEYEETVNKSKALMRAAEAAARFASGVGRGQ